MICGVIANYATLQKGLNGTYITNCRLQYKLLSKNKYETMQKTSTTKLQATTHEECWLGY